MRVQSVNSYINQNHSFGNINLFKNKKAEKVPEQENSPADELMIKKSKKIFAYGKWLIIGTGILFFGLKRHFKYEKIRKSAEKAADVAKLKVPEVIDLPKKMVQEIAEEVIN